MCVCAFSRIGKERGDFRDFFKLKGGGLMEMRVHVEGGSCEILSNGENK